MNVATRTTLMIAQNTALHTSHGTSIGHTNLNRVDMWIVDVILLAYALFIAILVYIIDRYF